MRGEVCYSSPGEQHMQRHKAKMKSACETAMFGNSCNLTISMRKVRNNAEELLNSGFHCQENKFGFYLIDEDSQQVRHLLGSACKKVPLATVWRRLVMRHHKSSGENQDRGV